jgi:RNA polymerase sigma factor (sigma-70 family)
VGAWCGEELNKPAPCEAKDDFHRQSSGARIDAASGPRNDYLREYGTEPTIEELIKATGFTRRQVETLQTAERTPRSLEERLNAHRDGAGTVGERIIDPHAEEAYAHVLDEIEIREVRDLADRLGTRERAVIRAHYGIGEAAQTLNQIGGALGLTAERARQIEVGALNKLRSALARPAPVWR